MKRLVDEVKSASSLLGTNAAAREAIDVVTAAIAKVAGEERVTIRGFGTFRMKQRAARNGRNPRTGETIRISEKNELTFKEAQ